MKAGYGADKKMFFVLGLIDGWASLSADAFSRTSILIVLKGVEEESFIFLTN